VWNQEVGIMANPDKKQMITEEFDKLTPEVMAQLEKQLSGAAARIYTKQDLSRRQDAGCRDRAIRKLGSDFGLIAVDLKS